MNYNHVIAVSLLIIAFMQVLSFGWEVSKWRHGIKQRERTAKVFPSKRP